MGLKQSIVIKNEFTHNGVNTPGKGSRGGTPGQYVLRYMARLDATETLTPVELNDEASIFDFTTRYMLREEATETLKTNDYASPAVSALKDSFKEQDGLTGRAFGRRGISLSDQAVRDSSQRIQDAFDEGHAVQKIVLSFTEDYLKDNGVVDPQFEHKGRGSYKGHVDQLKLRQAVREGVEKMTRVGNYKDPEWVGVIQVDTSHVHAHLALVDTDFSATRSMGDGHDKGKLNKREMMQLRRGIQYSLNEMKTVKSFHQHVSLERQNVVGFVKDYAYNHAGKSSQLQVLLASLPEEQQLWRYSTNRREMKRANELAEQFVKNVFHDQPVRSGYEQASRAIDTYIAERTRTEDLDPEQQRTLRKNGEALLVERSVNGVYGTLKAFDKKTLPIQTPMVDIQSSDEDELLASISDGFDQAGFELRVRGYSNRRDHHESKSDEYKQLMTVFDTANEQGQVSPDAFMLRRFYEEELEWHMGLTDKYRSFFTLNEKRDREQVSKHRPQYEALAERYRTIHQYDAFLEAVDNGTALTELDGIESEEDIFEQAPSVNAYIEDVYGLKQGVRAFSSFYRESLESDINEEKADYMTDLKAYTFDCFRDGVATQKDWSRLQVDHRHIEPDAYQEAVSDKALLCVPPKPPQTRSDGITDDHFDSVKALDIHHLAVDYYGKQDRSIASRFRETFAEAMRWREYFVAQAKAFLHKTGQSGRTRALDAVDQDVNDMRRCVDDMSRDGLIPTIDPIEHDASYKRNSRTIRLDTGVDVMPAMNQELVHFSPDELEQRERQAEFEAEPTSVDVEPGEPLR